MSEDAQVEYDVVSLAELREYEDLFDHVKQKLQAFRCARSAHLQKFANGDVWKYEKHGHSRTYVFLTPGDGDGIDVPAFFAVGKAVLNFERASNSQRRRLMGDISMEVTGAYSIVELARCDSFTAEQLPGRVILREALDVIEQARRYIGGRYVLVDSQEVVFRKLYEPEGFKHVALAKPPRGMEGKDFVTSALLVK